MGFSGIWVFSPKKHDFLAVFGSKNAFFDFQIPKMAQKLVFLSKNVQNISKIKKKKRGENTLILGELINYRGLVVASATANRQLIVQGQYNTVCLRNREGSDTLTYSEAVVNPINRTQSCESTR